MTEQRSCIVLFEPDLDENEYLLLVSAIQRFHGVKKIEIPASIANDNTKPQSYNQPTSNNRTRSSPNPSQDIVKRVMIWGMENQMITSDEITALDGQGLVDKTLVLIEHMPDSLKQQFFMEINDG